MYRSNHNLHVLPPEEPHTLLHCASLLFSVAFPVHWLCMMIPSLFPFGIHYFSDLKFSKETTVRRFHLFSSFRVNDKDLSGLHLFDSIYSMFQSSAYWIKVWIFRFIPIETFPECIWTRETSTQSLTVNEHTQWIATSHSKRDNLWNTVWREIRMKTNIWQTQSTSMY